MMLSGARHEFAERILGVCQEFARRNRQLIEVSLEGYREFTERSVDNDGPRYSLGFGPSSDDVVGSHRKFTRRFAEGIGKLAGNAKGDRQINEATTDDGPRYSLGIRLSSDDAVGSRRKFTRRFAERIEKLAGHAKGDHREEDWRTCRKIAGGCQSMRDSSWTTRTIEFERRQVGVDG
ncbi:hypothetical protein GW17_00050384 [Ensete ventricosum]|nr:hypothetical protein GW17_00050384 [Ensete ventricosum]